MYVEDIAIMQETRFAHSWLATAIALGRGKHELSLVELINSESVVWSVGVCVCTQLAGYSHSSW